MLLPFPPEFIVSRGSLQEAGRATATSLGLSANDVEEAFRRVPVPLREAPAFTSLFSPSWQYSFGDPFALSNGASAIGTPQGPEVAHLLGVIHTAIRLLSESQLKQWFSALANPAKHLDALVEMMALATIRNDQSPIYEPENLAANCKRIDWLVPIAPDRGVLLEVKNRLGPLVQELERLKPWMEAGASSIPLEPTVAFTDLFKSTLAKFHPVGEAIHIQGVLVFLSLKVPRASLCTFFRTSLLEKLHFIALTANGRTVFIEAHTEQLKLQTLSALGWREDADRVF